MTNNYYPEDEFYGLDVYDDGELLDECDDYCGCE